MQPNREDCKIETYKNMSKLDVMMSAANKTTQRTEKP